MSNILSLSACLVLSLLIASHIDCSALVIADGHLTQGQAVPVGWPRCVLACCLQRDTRLLLSQAVWRAKGCHRLWDLLTTISKGCHLYPCGVVLHLLSITARCPTGRFSMLLVSSESLHLPLLPLYTSACSTCVGTFHTGVLG